jgi:aspartyl protease family protein
VKTAGLKNSLIVFLGVALLAWTVPALAVKQVVLLALSADKAILRIDGSRYVLAAGDTSPEGVLLVEADTDQAVVEIDGRRQVLPLQAVVTPIEDGEDLRSVVLLADGSGFFHADGHINGRAVRFLVDTGANTVALSARHAQELGIDYRGGKAGFATTAGGTVRMYAIVLDRVDVGGIMLHNVTAGVIEGDYPQTPLLGMSFLGQLEMKRDGYRMELIEKY